MTVLCVSPVGRYSTRELVSVAKHLHLFPDDGVVHTLENVLSFDSFDPRLRAMLADVFTRHGIPVAKAASDAIAPPQVCGCVCLCVAVGESQAAHLGVLGDAGEAGSAEATAEDGGHRDMDPAP